MLRRRLLRKKDDANCSGASTPVEPASSSANASQESLVELKEKDGRRSVSKQYHFGLILAIDVAPNTSVIADAINQACLPLDDSCFLLGYFVRCFHVCVVY